MHFTSSSQSGGPPRSANFGFTMIELLVVVGIVAIIAAIAAPNFGELVARSRTASAVSELETALGSARAEALRRGTFISVCRSANASDAAPTCSSALSGGFAGNDWAAGWLVFVDADGNGIVGTDEQVLVSRQALNGGTGQRVYATATDSDSAAVATLTYQADGLRLSGAKQVQFAISDENAGSNVRSQRCVTVLIPGQFTATAAAC